MTHPSSAPFSGMKPGVRALRAALQEAMDSGLTGPEIRREC